MKNKTCSKCKINNPRTGQRYCTSCHAEHMRVKRPKHSQMPYEARKRANCRAMANKAQRQGLLIKPDMCQTCGSGIKLEKHHEDYNKPLDVIWLCRNCHIQWHIIFP